MKGNNELAVFHGNIFSSKRNFSIALRFSLLINGKKILNQSLFFLYFRPIIVILYSVLINSGNSNILVQIIIF